MPPPGMQSHHVQLADGEQLKIEAAEIHLPGAEPAVMHFYDDQDATVAVIPVAQVRSIVREK